MSKQSVSRWVAFITLRGKMASGNRCSPSPCRGCCRSPTIWNVLWFVTSNYSRSISKVKALVIYQNTAATCAAWSRSLCFACHVVRPICSGFTQYSAPSSLRLHIAAAPLKPPGSQQPSPSLKPYLSPSMLRSLFPVCFKGVSLRIHQLNYYNGAGDTWDWGNGTEGEVGLGKGRRGQI